MSTSLLKLSQEVSELARSRVSEILKVTQSSNILALNAMIEAKRAGQAGLGL